MYGILSAARLAISSAQIPCRNQQNQPRLQLSITAKLLVGELLPAVAHRQAPPHLMILRFPLISFITVRLVPIVEAPGLMPPVLAMQLATLHWGSQDLGLE